MTLSTQHLLDLQNWLLTAGRQANGLGQMLVGLSDRLRRLGIPLDRSTIGAPLLHPVAQSSFCGWDLENGLTERFLLWDESGLSKLKNSPMYPIYTAGQDTDWRLDSDADAAKFSVGPELRQAGFTHYLALALPFADGSHKAFTAQTRQQNGFTPEQCAFLKSLIAAIAAATEHHAQRSLATTLMNTFVGERAGPRVLDGQVHRGDGEHIQCVIWMCDLRGFTQFAANRPSDELLDALNHYFDAVADAVMSEGGEVLKFIGDAVLGIFPISSSEAGAVGQAERAADKLLKAKQTEDWPQGLDFGIGLHFGEVFYGNVGGRTRLDFTVIGQAVNFVSRLEALCREFDRPLLVSEQIASRSDRTYQVIGTKTPKGFDHPVPIYA